jgi:PRTRC genetic system ThiF family protein
MAGRPTKPEKEWRSLHRSLERINEQLKGVKPDAVPKEVIAQVDRLGEKLFGPKAGAVYWQRTAGNLRQVAGVLARRPESVPREVQDLLRRGARLFDSPYPGLAELRPAQLRLAPFKRVRLALVGCGGTGSWLAPQVARLARLILEEHEVPVSVAYVDFDTVEGPNLVRQNFCAAELGLPKAVALAQRYSAAYGVEAIARVAPLRPGDFQANFTPSTEGLLNVVVGCVDSAVSRLEIARVLDGYKGYGHRTWWLDCGNSLDRGQVYLGSAAKLDELDGAFPLPTICRALPSPVLIDPKLGEPEAEPAVAASCAAIAQASSQSRSINQVMAAIAATYLFRLFHGTLEYFATYVNAVTGEMRSTPITVDNVAQACGAAAERMAAPIAGEAFPSSGDAELDDMEDDEG